MRELRFAYVAGVTPGKWIRRWEERMPDVPLHSFMSDDGAQLAVLRDGSADLSFVRLPVEREGLSVIPLYEEQPVVVAPKGHEISVFEEVALADLSEETFLDVAALGGPETALQVVATGAGLVILPMSVARHFNVKDTVARKLTGAPTTEIALAWPSDSPRTKSSRSSSALSAAGRPPAPASRRRSRRSRRASRSRTGAGPPSRSRRWRNGTRRTRTRAGARDPGKRANAKARPCPRPLLGAGVLEGLDGIGRNLVAGLGDLAQRGGDLGGQPRRFPHRRPRPPSSSLSWTLTRPSSTRAQACFFTSLPAAVATWDAPSLTALSAASCTWPQPVRAIMRAAADRAARRSFMPPP